MLTKYKWSVWLEYADTGKIWHVMNSELDSAEHLLDSLRGINGMFRSLAPTEALVIMRYGCVPPKRTKRKLPAVIFDFWLPEISNKPRTTKLLEEVSDDLQVPDRWMSPLCKLRKTRS
jgi:hypothetical protein